MEGHLEDFATTEARVVGFWGHDRLERVSRDVETTLGWDNRRAWEHVVRWSSGSEEPAAAVQDAITTSFIDTSWPVCPLHGEHPLVPRARGDDEVWTCSRTGELVAPVGELTG